MTKEQIKELDKANLMYLVIASLISSDKIRTVEDCLDSKEKIEDMIKVISDMDIGKKHIYLRLLNSSLEIISNDLILLQQEAIFTK